jgi:hypothetical protein
LLFGNTSAGLPVAQLLWNSAPSERQLLFESTPMLRLFLSASGIVGLALAFCGSIRAQSFSIGASETIYTKSQRSSGGSSWPDGSFGVVSNGNGTYDFYAANSSKTTLTTGTLTDPAASKTSVSITGVPKGSFSYLAGGPIFEDPYSGARLMIYHAEKGGKGKSFYSMLGMAISTDPEGRYFRDLGVIVRPNVPSGQAELGGGSFAVVDGYMNVYYRDTLTDGSTAEVAVARAPMAQLISNALAGQSTAFNKYYNGAWNEPGIGGKASYLETTNAANSWLSVSYNNYLKQYMMVSSQWSGDGGDLYFATSANGLNWSARQPLAVDPGEQFYPTIVGTGGDPTHSDKSFYVYYTDSNRGAWGRWKDAQLRRREITVNSPAGSTGHGDSLGYTASWTTSADYQSEFQSGGPGAGWTYAWDPKGKLGKSTAYAPLTWSNTANAYTTTGGLINTPNPKAHHDDYLSLTSVGGHPGQSKYMPIVGYTIQQDDGDGFYRLADTSIELVNTSPQLPDDGLRILVYLNDTLIGSPQIVLPNGVATNFDRTLGTLHVGDTVWVMIDPRKNNSFDAFTNFDFSLQKLVFSAQNAVFSTQLVPANAVPEPAAASLLLISITAVLMRRSR